MNPKDFTEVRLQSYTHEATSSGDMLPTTHIWPLCSLGLGKYTDDLNKVKLLIITGKYEIPHAIDQHALGLMRRLLSQSPERRNVTGPHLLAVHPAYFRGVNLVQLVQRVFIPPLRPPRPPLNPYAYRTRGAALDHARKYKDREEVRPRDPYGGFFNHFHYLKSPWVANKEGQQPFPIPPTDDMQD